MSKRTLEHDIIKSVVEAAQSQSIPEASIQPLTTTTLPLPLISIILPVYNAALFLDECLQSIYDQTYAGPFEISIFDDLSTDESPAILQNWLEKFKSKPNIMVILSRNDGSGGKGVGFARNKGVRQSSGRFLCFFDSDDVMLPRRLEAQLEIALACPNAIVGSNFSRIPDDATARYTEWANRLRGEDLYLQRFREVTIIQPTWMVSRERFDLVGGYENGHLLPEDLIFFYKHLSLKGELSKSNEVLLKYRWHPGMTSFKITRKTLMNYRVKAFEKDILTKVTWSTFMIWSSGRDGKQFYKTLSEENQRRVTAFCDINEKKIGTSIVLNHTTKHSVPIRHWKEIKAPFVCCVAMDRYADFETNVASLNLKQGEDFFHVV